MFIDTLGYFKMNYNRENFLKRAINLTGSHPYELHILNSIYVYESMLNFDNQFQNDFENNFDKLEKLYLQKKFLEIGNSHAKFITEYLYSYESKMIFLQLICHLDNGIEIKNADLINYNLMEVDNSMKLYSLCPAVKKYFDNLYELNKLSTLEKDLMKSALKRVYDLTSNVDVFQKLLELMFVHKIE